MVLLRLGAAQSAPWGQKPTGSSPAGLSFQEGPQLAAACLPSPSKGMQAGGTQWPGLLAGLQAALSRLEVRRSVEMGRGCRCPGGQGPPSHVGAHPRLAVGWSQLPWLPSLGGDLTWIWLRSTAARSIMALARRWNSLPISRDFSKWCCADPHPGRRGSCCASLRGH